jgi:phage recombination protein Bet
MTQTVRNQAVARQDEMIASNVAAIQQKKTAVSSMADRLNISPSLLKSTLMNTVFKGASEEEFAALVVVADAYKLNPLLKEIYAFPQKGGGIVPLVSIDGWVRIMNEHPQFNGIEFEDIADEKGKLYAIECTIFRKDRDRPIKVTEYLEECKGNSGPWQKSPARMLRHRSLIQCARYAFGFSGIYVDDEMVGDIQLGGDIRPVVPMRNATASLPQIETTRHDPNTGEILDEQEIAAQLDRQGYDAMEGRSNDQHDGRDEEHPGVAIVADIVARAGKVEIVADLIALTRELSKHADALPDDLHSEATAALQKAEDRLNAKGGK